jgi:hypothetical protein
MDRALDGWGRDARGHADDPTRVYVELLTRHVDNGVVQMATDEEHAFAAGYDGARGVRSWRERMRLLEDIGVIKIRSMGAKRYAYVLLVHPTGYQPDPVKLQAYYADIAQLVLLSPKFA